MIALAAGASRARAQCFTEALPTWETPAVFPAGAFPFGIDAADAMGPVGEFANNLDGYPDIVVGAGHVSFYRGDTPNFYTNQSSQVLFFRNSQDWTPTSGGLTDDPNLTIDLPNRSIAAEVKFADITGDGRNDVVVTATTHYDASYPAGAVGVYVYRWDNGAFAFWQFVPAAHALRGLVVADFDADGDLDVVGAVDSPEPINADRDKVAIYLNNDDDDGSFGNGLLGPVSMQDIAATGVQPGPHSVVSGHFQKVPGGSLYPDLVASRWDSYGAQMVGQGDGTFSVSTIAPCHFAAACGMAVGRFQLGKLSDDVAAWDAGGLGLLVYHSTPSGVFTHDCDEDVQCDFNDIYFDEGGSPPNPDFIPIGVASGQLNGGVKVDLAVGSNSTGPEAYVWILLGKGNKKFEFQNIGTTYQVNVDDGTGLVEYPLRVRIADMDLDGYPDILTANHGSEAEFGSISVVINATGTP